jgi:hypothetical protein
MDLTTIDLSKGTYTVRVPRKERSFLASLDDWTFELGAFMWLEGLFEEDPALKGRSAMKHNLILTAPSGANALFEHVCLSADGLEFDYIPHSWGAALPLWEKRVGEVYSHLVDEHGMFEDNHSASQWARNGPRIVSRGLPRVRADWPDGKNITEAVLMRRFYQKCFIPNDKDKPNASHLRWYTRVLDISGECHYGDLICLHDEGASEFRLLSYSQTLPLVVAKKLFEMTVADHRDFIDSLEA